MNFIYPVICHYEDDGYWSEFPDLEGCFSQGNTELEIIENSKESLEGYLLTELENGNILPQPSLIKNISTPKDGFVSYVECGISSETKFVRKNVTLPKWLCTRAEKNNINFSQILQDALQEKLLALK